MSLNKPNKIQIIKYAPPPSDLPVLGKVDQDDVVFIGRTNYVASLEEKKFIFGLKRVDRKRHVYIIGKSGVGKSKIQELMIRQDIAYGYGVCVIDPHGDLITDILNFVGEDRINDVCIIDPGDVDFPISFNPLSGVSPIFKNQLTQSFVEILKKQFDTTWSPRLEHLFRFSMLAILDYTEPKMKGIVSLLTDRDYRQKIIPFIEDEMVKKFWQIEFDEWSSKFDTDTIAPLVNKLSQFLSDPMLRNIFSQTVNKIDIDKLINEKKIILINLSKDKIGEENSSFLGAIFLAKIKQAGIGRVNLDSKSRQDFYLYLDEFQNIATDSFESMLSESRKYGVDIIIAHQYLSQLSPKIEQAILNNVGTIITFRVGGDDAIKLKPEFAPIFDIKDMINLGIGEFYIKMIIEGESYDPFSAETLRVLPATHRSYKEEIIKSSRSKYAVTKEEALKLISS